MDLFFPTCFFLRCGTATATKRLAGDQILEYQDSGSHRHRRPTAALWFYTWLKSAYGRCSGREGMSQSMTAKAKLIGKKRSEAADVGQGIVCSNHCQLSSVRAFESSLKRRIRCFQSLIRICVRLRAGSGFTNAASPYSGTRAHR